MAFPPTVSVHSFWEFSNPIDNMLAASPFLLTDRPLFVDYNLYGIQCMHFDILCFIMSADASPRRPLESDRREYYRITVTLPIYLQAETDTTEGPFVEKSVNLSAGGIGLIVNQLYNSNDILSCTLLLAEQVRFTSPIEVLRVDIIPYPPDTYRLHARFIKMTRENRELLVRHILQLQREHLTKHYSV